MNKCDLDQLSLYLDGGLTSSSRLELERHLLGCAICRDELAGLRRVDQVVTTWGSRRTPIPAATEARLAGKIAARRRFGFLLGLSRMAPAAVGSSIAALLVLVSVNLSSLYGPATVAGGPNGPTEEARVFQKQSQPLVKARRTSALLGSHAAPEAPTPPLRRILAEAD